MKIVVDVDENVYTRLFDNGIEGYSIITDDIYKLAIALRKGTPFYKVIDEIKAEIEQNAYPIVHGVNNHEKGMTLYGILQVIDKYRGEEDETDN